MKKRILLVEGESGLPNILNVLLSHTGYDVVAAAQGRDTRRVIAEESIDLLIMDLVMPEKDAIETIRSIRKRRPDLPIVAISGIGYGYPGNYLGLARSAGVDRHLIEPFHYRELLAIIDGYLKTGSCPTPPPSGSQASFGLPGSA